MTKIYLTPTQISTVTKAGLENVKANWPLVCQALEWAGINLPLVQVGMAATIAIETGSFSPIKEHLSKQPGSPLHKAQMRYWPSGYNGRGYIQLTWQKNYEAAGKALKIDLLGNPGLALEPAIAARAAAWFFKANKIHDHCGIGDWEQVRKAVNGPGYHKDAPGLEKFLRYCNLLAGFASLNGGDGQNGGSMNRGKNAQ
jgi:predicted chitinase